MNEICRLGGASDRLENGGYGKTQQMLHLACALRRTHFHPSRQPIDFVTDGGKVIHRS